MRYLVFGYNWYYPLGGMQDCVLKTNTLEEARQRLWDLQDEYSTVNCYDTVEDQAVAIPERDPKEIET